MRKIRRLAALLLLVCTLIPMTACAPEEKEGFEEIKNARQLYLDLDSAYVTVTDMMSEQTVAVCAFRFEGEKLTYYLLEVEDETAYLEYYDGKTLSYAYAEDETWTIDEQGSTKYSKSNRQRYASRTLLFFEPESISSSTLLKTQEGSQVNLAYDVSKMTPAFCEFYKFDQTPTMLSSSFVFGADGRVKYFQHIGKFGDKDFNYKVTISNPNGVKQIDKPNLFDYKKR